MKAKWGMIWKDIDESIEIIEDFMTIVACRMGMQMKVSHAWGFISHVASNAKTIELKEEE